jgi:hypothetical protein
MGELRSCTVSYADGQYKYSVEVTAETLYEAAVLGFKALNLPAKRLPVLQLQVAVKSPEVSHEISGSKVADWLSCSGRSPREQALKVRLKELLQS